MRSSRPESVCKQRAEDLAVDQDLALGPRLGLGPAEGRQLGLREHRGRDQRMGRAHRPRREHRLGEGLAVADRHRGQGRAIGDVADGIDRGHRGLRPVVDPDRAVGGEADAERLEAEPGGVRVAPGGEEHLVGDVGLAVVGRHLEAGAVALDRGHLALDLEDDAARPHRRRQVVAQVVVEAAQDLVGADQLGDLGAEPVHDARELAGDVAAADDEQALGLLLELEHLVGGDAELGARDIGPDRMRAGGDQQVPGRVLRAVGQPHPVRVEHAGADAAELHPGPAQAVVVGRFQPRDLGVLGGDELLPVEPGLADGPAVAGGIVEGVGEARGVDHQLLRHAAADHAGAAVAVLLGQPDLGPGLGRDPGGAHPARTAADDEEVEVEPRHHASWLRISSAISTGSWMRAPGRSRSSVEPSSWPITTALARPMKRPCSTTPGSAFSAAASAGGSPIRPRCRSMMKLPSSVTSGAVLAHAHVDPVAVHVRRRDQLAHRAPGDAPAEAHDLDRQREGAEPGHALGLIGDHHHAVAGAGDDLLLQAAPRRRP